MISMNARETEEEENRAHQGRENGIRNGGGGDKREMRESVVRVSERFEHLKYTAVPFPKNKVT